MSLRLTDYETLEFEPNGEVLRIWLNRPESRNAHNQQMIKEVGDIFLALNAQTEFRVAVLGGRGKSFCAGADRKETSTAASNDVEARYRGQLGRRAVRAIEDCEVVTIARVHGTQLAEVVASLRLVISDWQRLTPLFMFLRWSWEFRYRGELLLG